VSFEEAVTEPSWYYLRVTLVDGEMAWSSPVWVHPLPRDGSFRKR
jgi:hypothetical protein